MDSPTIKLDNTKGNLSLFADISQSPSITKASARFNERILSAKQLGPMRTAVVWPCSEESMMGVDAAVREGLILPHLIGPQAQISALAKSLGIKIDDYEISDISESEQAANHSLTLFSQDRVKMLMKGSLSSREFLLSVVTNRKNLKTKVANHLMAIDIPASTRTVFVADAGFNEELKGNRLTQVVINSVEALIKLGISQPKVAILSAVEYINPSIKSTILAFEAAQVIQEILGDRAIVEGPLSFDTAVSLKVAQGKGLSTPVAGQADLLIAQDITTANCLVKALPWAGNGYASGTCLGITIPIAFPSRGGNVLDRLGSCALAMLLSR